MIEVLVDLLDRFVPGDSKLGRALGVFLLVCGTVLLAVCRAVCLVSPIVALTFFELGEFSAIMPLLGPRTADGVFFAVCLNILFFCNYNAWMRALDNIDTFQRGFRTAKLRVSHFAVRSVKPILEAAQQTIALSRADVDYEYNRALRENRIKDARRIRFEGRFIILKAATYDLVVTLFEYATNNVKNLFRLG